MIKIGTAGLIGYDAVRDLAEQNREFLESRFSKRFLCAFDSLQNMAGEFQGAKSPAFSQGVCLTPITEGGLFGTIWRTLDELETLYIQGSVRECAEAPGDKPPVPFQNANPPFGCRIYLRDIPVRQEIIEICELFGENPYELPSQDAYLALWDADRFQTGNSPGFLSAGKEHLTMEIVPDEALKILVTEIGYITNTKDRLIINGDMVRYLTPLKRQLSDIADRQAAFNTGKRL